MSDILHALARRYPLEALPSITDRYERKLTAAMHPMARHELRRGYDRYVFYANWIAGLLALTGRDADSGGAAS